MKPMLSLHLQIISQAKPLLEDQVDLVLLPGVEGELGILPHHIPLITKLQPGVVTIRKGKQENLIAVSGGFATMEVNNHLTILADTAIAAPDVSLREAQEAKLKAEEKMKQKDQISQREFRIAEAQLRRALAELQVARKRHHPSGAPPL